MAVAATTSGLPTEQASPARPAAPTAPAKVDPTKITKADAIVGLPSECSQQWDGRIVCAIGADGKEHSFPISYGATSFRYTLAGGAGGGGGGGSSSAGGGAGGSGARMEGYPGNAAGRTVYIGVGSAGHNRGDGGTNPSTRNRTFNGGWGGDGTGTGGAGGHAGAASVIQFGSSVQVVAGGGGGGSGGVAGKNGFGGGGGGTDGGRTNETTGGNGGSGGSSSGSGGGGGGGGWWAGNSGGGGGVFSRGDGGQGGQNTLANGATSDLAKTDNNGDGYAYFAWYRSDPTFTLYAPTGVNAYRTLPAQLFWDTSYGTTGTVTVTDSSNGGRVVCTANVSADQCVIPDTQLSGGVHNLVASYSGDTGFNPVSTSATMTVQPNSATAAITATPRAADNTVDLNATVTPNATDGVVDGTVSFSSQPASAALAANCGVLTTPVGSTARRGLAFSRSCNAAMLPGNYTITASLMGSSNTSATSATTTLSIAKYTPQVSLDFSPDTLPNYGATTTATVRVQGQSGALADPTGTVTLTSKSGKGGTCTIASPSTTVNHVATYTCTITPAGGTQTYNANYAGDSSYSSSASGAEDVTTAAVAPDVTLTPSATTVPVGNTLTLAATAEAPDGTKITAGSLTFYDGPIAADGSNVVGTVDLAANPGGGSITVTPNAGTHKYQVQFVDAAGSQNYVTTTIVAAPVFVQPLDATMAVDVTAASADATSAGIPTTATVTLTVPTQDALTRPITLDPAPAQPCTRSEAVVNGKRVITAVCAYVRAPGSVPTFSATYTDDLVGDRSASASTFRIPASPVTVTASGTDVTYGARTQLSATVVPTVSGAAVTGTVAFAEGTDQLCTATVSTVNGAASATCASDSLPHAGSHDVTASFTPDAAGAATALPDSSPTASFAVAQARASISLATSAGKVNGDDTLTATAGASVDGGGPTPTGSVRFTDKLAACGTVTLTNGIAVCRVPLPAAGTKSTVTATYLPGADFTAGATTSVSRSYQRPVAGACTGGFALLWAAAVAAKGSFALDAGALGSVTLTTDPNLGDCDSSAVLDATANVSLFSGTLKASSVAVSVTSDELCLNSGSLALPAVWKSGALKITEAACFPITSAGGIGAPTSGRLALTNSGGQGAPLISIPGVTAAASLTAQLGTACPNAAVDEGTCASPAPAVTVTAAVARTSDTVPGVTVVATVRTDGSIGASVASTPIAVFGTTVALAGSVSRQGTGALSASVSATLASAATPVAGLSIDPGATVTLSGGTGSSPTLTVDGTVRLAAGTSTEVAVQLSGSFTSAASYSLSLNTGSSTPTWTPIDGLTMAPVLSGSLSRSAGKTTFAMSATGSGGSPLATWNAPGGVVVTVNAVSIGGDPTAVDLKCPFTDGLTMAMSGSIAISDLSVAASGCVSLGTKSWHVAATSTGASLGRLSLSNLVLEATGRPAANGAGGTKVDVVGSATASLSVGSYSGSTTVTMQSVDGVFVVGGQIDATSLGLPSKYTYLAYASADTTGWQTGLGAQGLGDGGEVDLPAGISLFGAMTLPSGVASVLRKAKFTLPADATVTFEAFVPKSGGSLSFTAELGTPSGMPLLTLPGGATVQSATVGYANGTFSLAADGTVRGQDGKAAATHLQVSISKDGTLAGSASVTGLGLFGRTVDIAGSLSRTSAGVMSANLTGKITGAVQVGDATLNDITVSIGTNGLAASGRIDVASTSVAFTAAFASTTSYSLDVAVTVRNWTPATGVTVNAQITGSLTRSAKGYSYDFAATPLDSSGGLISLTPVAGVTLALNSFELSNRETVPVDCIVKAKGDTWLAVSGSLSLTVGSSGGTGTGSGCFDLTNPSFAISVTVPGATFGGEGGKVSLSGLAVTITRDSSGAFTADARARLKVEMATGGQFSLLAVLTFSKDGFAIGGLADLSSFLGGSAAKAYLFFSNAAMSVKTGDSTVGTLKLRAGITVGLAFTVSDTVAAALKQVGMGVGAGSKLVATVFLDLNNATIVMRVGLTFSSTNLFSLQNGTYLRLDDLALAMTLSPTQPSFAFETSGTLHVPASVPGGADSDITLKGGIRIGTELSAYLSVENWDNALGLNGFNLRKFTLQGGITLTGLPLPSLAVQATVDGLPQSLANVIGYRQGAPMSIALAIGETNLLFDVKIGTKDSTDVALAPFAAFGRADLLEVNYAELYMSPTGATIGDEVFPPGFALAFQGRIAGVSVDVLAKIDPVKGSVYFRGSVGTISIGSLVIGPTTLEISAGPGQFDLNFSGRIAIGPSTTQIGPLLRFSGYLKADVTIGIGTSGISAHLNFEASVSSSNYLPQSWCKSYGFWYLCNYQWIDTSPLTITANNIGFAINSSGLTVDIPNTYSSITFPWPSSPLSARERSLTGARTNGVQSLDVSKAGGLAPITGQRAATPTTAARTWQSTGALGTGRVVAGGLALRDGSVLAAGGADARGHALATAEVYDPSSGGWHAVAPMHTARTNPTTVQLRDGRVLVVGGDTGTGETASAEIFDPRKGTWTDAGSMSRARQASTATVLPDGSVLIVGGHVAGRPVTTVDRFQPGTSTWTTAAPLPTARAAAASATLANGDLLVAGGMGAKGPLRTVDVYDVASGTWHAAAPMAHARFYAAATRLSGGDVLVAGGSAEAERFDPATGRWRAAGSLDGPAMLSSMVTTADGDVIVAGGIGATGTLAQVDRFHPASNHWTRQAALPAGRAGSVAALLPTGGVLVAGGLTGRSARGGALTGRTAATDSFVYMPNGVQAVPTKKFAAAPVASGSTLGTWSWVALAIGLLVLFGALVAFLRRRRPGQGQPVAEVTTG